MFLRSPQNFGLNVSLLSNLKSMYNTAIFAIGIIVFIYSMCCTLQIKKKNMLLYIYACVQVIHLMKITSLNISDGSVRNF